MITQEHVQQLTTFADGHLLTSSFYLDVDGKRWTRKQYEIAAKDLIEARKADLKQRDLTREQRASIEQDFDRIWRFVAYDYQRGDSRGLAVFCCSGRDWWRALRLPRSVDSRYVIERTPYVRPLTALLDEYPRTCVVLADRPKARVFVIDTGEIMEHSELVDDVPSRVKSGSDEWHGTHGRKHGGVAGEREQKIARHVDEQVRHHLKHAADVVFNLFKREGFEGLLIGGPRETRLEFEGVLHTDLQARLVRHLDLSVTARPDEVLESSLAVMREHEREQKAKLVRRVLEESSRGAGWAVTGLLHTLGALNLGAVQTLVVSDRLSVPGAVCRACGMLDDADAAHPTTTTGCSICGDGQMEPVPDIVDKAVAKALSQSARIKYVTQNAEFTKAGGIGALLRFAVTVPPPTPPAGGGA